MRNIVSKLTNGPSRFHSIISKKQVEVDACFEKLRQRHQMNSVSEKILKWTDEELTFALQNRQISAVAVLDAYTTKALEATQQFNCVTEFIPHAKAWAEELDKLPSVKGPLHGLPVSVKENFYVKDMDATIGLGKYVFQPSPDSAVVVKALIDLGAVPFCKTNLPQTMFSFGCGNPIFGETVNPLRPNLSCGGSSGGEGCILGAGASVIGLGTDVAGSIRIPSHFCGIPGLKPTRTRMSIHGLRPTGAHPAPIMSSPGFMARNVKTLSMTYKHFFEQNPQTKYDPLVMPLPWNETLFSTRKKLRIGYFTQHKYFPPIGDTESVVLSAKRALEKDGHELIPCEIFDSYEMAECLTGLFYADCGSAFRKLWKGENVPDCMFLHYWISHIPLPFRKMFCYLQRLLKKGSISPFIHSPLATPFILGGSKTAISSDLWDHFNNHRRILVEVVTKWKSLELDLILSPSFPFPAIPLDLPGLMLPAVIYTAPWNALDFPAGVVPFGTESGSRIDTYDNRDDYLLRRAQEGTKQSIGMPISVQLIGLPFKDELVLHGMQILESLKPKFI